MPKRKIAIWFRRGRDLVVKVPGWDNRVDLVFTRRNDMIEWAHSNGYVLRDGNKEE